MTTHFGRQWSLGRICFVLGLLFIHHEIIAATGRTVGVSEVLTACQHLRQAESRRAKALGSSGTRVRVPRCTKIGDFESVQCAKESSGEDCLCVDEYGVEIPGTRNETRSGVICAEPVHCLASSCRMFCPSGFARDIRSGCSICKCRDPCEDVICPGGQVCQQQEVQCLVEPCPPIPTCKKARSLANWCPAGEPLSIATTKRPFLCGTDPGKPSCPPLFECLVDMGNDYGVCCPNTVQFTKPGVCPNKKSILRTDSSEYNCGKRCDHDLECKQMEKCCFDDTCQFNCQQPVNITNCHQARALSEILSVNEREGRGYIPKCDGKDGKFSAKQCSRNGLVCWCVNPKTGNKIKSTMGAASIVNCDGVENMIARSLGRSMNADQCDKNICAAICEYGFKVDHNGCPTCECSEPCEGFLCPMSSHCEVARDVGCTSGSALCASIPVCKPDLVYSNPCEIDSPLTDNITGEVFYCHQDERQSRGYSIRSFFDDDPKEGRAMSNQIKCPENYQCTKLHKETYSVCCPIYKEEEQIVTRDEGRQQSMCEYLRDFSDRMEGTEAGMQLALKAPKCAKDGSFEAQQCKSKKIQVTRSEKRKILEEKNIRNMRQLLTTREKRSAPSNLKLHPIDEGSLSIESRNAKVIDQSSLQQQNFDGIFETKLRKVAQIRKYANIKEELEEVEVEECWCVDGFGTEIPESRGSDVTSEKCESLRESLDCLDLTCRMGCDYGFVLDSDTKCPACHCRDPCDGVSCEDGYECRTVDVSCDGEYCPPVPACLPRKPGQCPFLVPPGSDDLEADACAYECRSDAHCDGSKRCCSNGCGTQCVEPQLKTACQHLKTIQMHQASELGIPAKQTYIVQCNESTGKWKTIQCGAENICWCVDDYGQEISGTRIQGSTPVCKINSAFECPLSKCSPCEYGYKIDSNGCRTCECRSPCDEISCLQGEECQLVNVECIDTPCSKMPICVPKRDSICPEGNPLIINEKEVICGPQHENESCPTTHTCQLNPMSHRGVCCAKTRDVCFDSIDNSCVATSSNQANTTKWRFSPKQNKCVSIKVPINDLVCMTKNLFHNELACKSVCPVLTQCERLKLKNELAARRSGQTSIWFQPRCDPVTGYWSPVQCLGKQPNQEDFHTNGRHSSFSEHHQLERDIPTGVCWCADKKGAPLKGSLTRDYEPTCNHRQARRRMHTEEASPSDPLMEDLIKQMTLLVEMDGNELFEDENTTNPIAEINLVTERIFTAANAIIGIEAQIKSTKELLKTTTRCRALSKTASFPVACDENGAFLPTQCNGDQCWCVDAAGNQLPATNTFEYGTEKCTHTPINSVLIKLHLVNKSGKIIENLYELLNNELTKILGDNPGNLIVHENVDGSAQVQFELHNEAKIDTAFSLEDMVKQNHFYLGNGRLKPDITLSRFIHRNQQFPVAQAASGMNEGTFQTIIFVLATASAFLVSIFVVFIMLKRGRRKVVNTFPENRTPEAGDKYLDYSSPIFVLSASEKNKLKSQLEKPVNTKPSEH